MHPFKSGSLFASIVLSLSAAACSGTNPGPIQPADPQAVADPNLAAPIGASVPVASSLPSAAPSAPSNSSNPVVSSVDAGTDAAPSQPRTMPLQCNFTPYGASQLCLETAEGHAGDIVDMDVFFRPDAANACTIANGATGEIRFDPQFFELVNVASRIACSSRTEFPDATNPGMNVVMWEKFGAGSIASCPDVIAVGKVDTIKVRIKPGTPPGDYNFHWNTSQLSGGTVGCDSVEHTNAELRVLP